MEMPRSRRDFLGATTAVSAALGLTPFAGGQGGSPSPWPSLRSKAVLDLFGLKYPIFQAGFGAAAGVPLAAAVSNAGAMGAVGSLGSPDNARDIVSKLRAATKGPFFVNIILQLQPANPPATLPVALDAGAPVVQFSWGIPALEAVSMIRSSGAKFGMQVTSKESARMALDLGADYLVCQGTEAGGHVQAHRGLFEALPMVLEEAKNTPVIAAGGIGDGSGIYKALSAGAGAAMLGTRFVATVESNAHRDYKQALIAAKARETALTICFQDGWLATHRVLRNQTFVAWEAAGCPSPGKRPGEGDVVCTRPTGAKLLRYATMPPLTGFEGRLLECPLYAGQSVEVVKDLPSATDLVKRLWEECEAAHKGATSRRRKG
jgi:nitronate monooxygenase